MFKTSQLANELIYPSSDKLTPIRDYENDYFHKDDKKLPSFKRVQANPGRVKRPVSLDLFGPSERHVSKKVDSPLNVDLFANVVNLNTPTVNRESSSEFIGCVKGLYEGEIRYVELMNVANSTYRHHLVADPYLTRELLKHPDEEELLLFGNIDTIASISELFVQSLRRKLLLVAGANPHGELVTAVWRQLDTAVVQEELDMGDLFEQHFHRVKTAYLNYLVTQERQLTLLSRLKSRGAAYTQWMERCQGHLPLEEILVLPSKRLEEWIECMSRLAGIGGAASIQRAQVHYTKFQEQVQEETAEYNSNGGYNYSLTPMEIIESYTDPRDRFPSPSSSVYSNGTVARDDNEYTLQDHVSQFERQFKRLTQLRQLLSEWDMHGLLDTNVQFIRRWLPLVDEPVAEGYLSRAVAQRVRITALQRTHLANSVVSPLTALVKLSQRIRLRLRDLRVLRRDYVVYLREKKTNVYDVRRDVIGAHYEQLQEQLTRDLPRFLQTLRRTLDLIIRNFVTIRLELFELLIDGATKAKTDHHHTHDTHGHGDIVAQFYTHRHLWKRSALAGDPSQSPSAPGVPRSRVERRLFF
ncbi:Fus2p KNAG_0J00760 [Huiozyma naganishii CBS 8797]|uniref:DH domain-containing protein n=1 Tax=Huiozyma naganishii (strain ATCC MYA-139 / BCRC 22969 / CBS 8797 / KCTC 17520 / NBRC 10181 / NCYC 3082 / Yp74L-3) TaxID=1071383 RepID=J7S9K3_HUIN7|nr:hypothetical protein KNAG_0J00760 [Kazachstania naganishii CBS 8797]CCK72159.1 hypothetical protein KNAG_0J00760 [Kazachstania naganishii CBS 8797]